VHATGQPGDHGRLRWAWLALAAVVVIVAGVVTAIVATHDTSSGSVSNEPGSCAVTKVADRTLPSVVTISAQRGQAGGTGSGEVIRTTGEILTNNHVIAGAANGGSIEVTFSDGVRSAATLVGRDPRTDLAVIKVDAPGSYPVIPFGSTGDVRVGQPVVALGAPLGLSSTVTSGIVSALDRTVEVPADNGQTALLVSALQTDAAINPGNSGGALTDCDGRLVGVPTAGATVPNETGQSSAGNIGLGFAIPVDFARSVSDELIANGRVTHSFFGVEVLTMPPAAAQRVGLDGGLYVAAVVPGGPAARAGLRADDVITKLDGHPASDANQLAALTLTKRPGERVSVGYRRAGRDATLTVVLGTQP
jgi:putative serine protease PepD